MMWHNPDDPEAGYFGDETVRCAEFDDDGEFVCFVVPAECNICGGTLSDDATIPLCVGCEGDCKREVKELKHHREWDADGSPR